MVTARGDRPSGILNQEAGERRFHLSRYLPTQDIAFFVEHYWIVAWDQREQEPYRQETLPHPTVHLVVERGRSRVFGVMRGKFSHLLQGQGRVFGVKFRPGGFYPFVRSPVSTFTDGHLGVREALGIECTELEGAILTSEDEGQMVERMEAILRERLPARDETVEVIHRIVDRIISDREITKVDHLVSRLSMNKRSLQRLFSQYVGVSPKWVIKRYRLMEAAEQVANGDVVDWPMLARELGYFDQAHFIRDFKAIVGRAPTDYARLIATGS
jgi:AraC-like DNA-binding protein